MVTASEEGFARRIEHDREDEKHSNERKRKRVASNVLDPIKYLNRSHAVELKHERDAELGERPDESDRASGKEPGHDERQRDFAELAESGASEVFGGLAHSRIDVSQSRKDVQIEDGIKMQRVHRDHANKPSPPEPVHRMQGVHQPESLKKGIQRSCLPKDLLHSNCPHKRREDHWHQNQSAEKRLAGKNKPIAQEGEREGDARGQRRAAKPHEERVPEALKIDRIAENLEDIVERGLSIRPDKGPAKRLDHRPQKEDREEDCRNKENNSSEEVGHGLTQRRGGAEWKMGFRGNYLRSGGDPP